MMRLPQARWLAAARGMPAPIALNDAEAVLQAVRAGIGRSLLPRIAGDRDAGLRAMAPPAGLPPPPMREVWLLMHPDLRPLARVAAVAAWLEGLFGRNEAPDA